MKHRRPLSIGILTAALLLTAYALPKPLRYEVMPSDSAVTFTISKWTVFKEEGRFHDFDGVIDYSPAHPEETRVRFTVRTASVDTKKDARDETLRTDDFLWVDRYPTMDFVSTRVVSAGDGMLDVTGDLTIRGVTRRITVPVTVLGVTEVPDPPMRIAGFETTFVIDRTEFGVLGESWSGGRMILGHDVTIRLIVSARARRGEAGS